MPSSRLSSDSMSGAITRYPRSTLETWRLKIEGEVKNPLELTYAELSEMETHTIILDDGMRRKWPGLSRTAARRRTVGRRRRRQCGMDGRPAGGVTGASGSAGFGARGNSPGRGPGEIKEPRRPIGKNSLCSQPATEKSEGGCASRPADERRKTNAGPRISPCVPSCPAGTAWRP